MLPPTVVIAQNDPSIAQELTQDLFAHFNQVTAVRDIRQLRGLLSQNTPQVAVLDLELVGLEEVHRLSQAFQNLTVICTHRSPDERMWMESLKAGAVEFCHPQDIRSILRAARGATTRASAA